MKKSLFEFKVQSSKLKDIKFPTTGGVEITIGNEIVKLTDFHDQNCCESVYADFSILELYLNQLKDVRVKKVLIYGVEVQVRILLNRPELNHN